MVHDMTEEVDSVKKAGGSRGSSCLGVVEQ